MSKNVELSLRIKSLLARDNDGKLTHWATGRRFVFTAVPKFPLQEDFQVGIFSAELYHLKARRKEKKCGRYLLPSYMVAQCANEIVCLSCFEPGHRKSECYQPLIRPALTPPPTPSRRTNGRLWQKCLSLCHPSSTPRQLRARSCAPPPTPPQKANGSSPTGQSTINRPEISL